MGPIARLFGQPHRLYLATAGLLLVLPLLWWGGYLYFRLTLPLAYKANPLAVHGFGLLYGVFPMAALGFLFTAFPRWTGTLDQLNQAYLGPWWALTVGSGFYFAQLWIGEPWGRIGAFLLFAGLLWALMHLVRLFRAGQGFEKRQPGYVLFALFLGVVGSLFSLAHQLALTPQTYQLALSLGVYGFWPLLVLSISHRLVPFFTQSRMGDLGLKSYPQSLPLWTLGFLLKALGQMTDRQELWILSDSLLLVVTLVQFWGWKVWLPKKEGMLSYLYLSLYWLPVCLGLGFWAGVDRFLGGYNQHLSLAGLHALTIGLLAGMLLSMASRVYLGHSGQPVRANGFTHLCFFFLQLAALSRVGLELGMDGVPGLVTWIWLPVVFWLLCFGPWALRFLPLSFKPEGNEPNR